MLIKFLEGDRERWQGDGGRVGGRKKRRGEKKEVRRGDRKGEDERGGEGRADNH